MGTKIEWTDETLNPVVGCTKCSPGCKNCYAERMARRLQAMGKPQYADVVDRDGFWTGKIGVNMAVLDKLKTWRRPRRVFMVSMGDLFHENVPDSVIDFIFYRMSIAPLHTFQILTKRPERMLNYVQAYWPKLDRLYPHIWFGVTAENQEQADKRIPVLLQIPAAVRFVSIEPMLGPVDLSAYLDYNTQKGGIKYKQRRRALQPCVIRGMEDRSKWVCLDDEKRCMETGRTSNSTGIFTSQENDQGHQDVYRSAQVGIQTFSRENTERDNDQSPEWQEGRQQTGELGDSDLFREYETCLSDRTSEPGRGKESREQIIESSGRGNQECICSREYNPDRIVSEVQCFFSNNFQNSQGGTSPESARNNFGLYKTKKKEQGTKPERAIHQIIVGGETGPSARPMDVMWARSLLSQCQDADVPFFYKGAGTATYLKDDPNYRKLNGQLWEQFPGKAE